MKLHRGIAAALLLLSACAAPHSTPRGADSTPRDFDALPSWRYEPLSWSKLAAIEAWLDSPEATWAPVGLVTEGQLALAEGRLAFAEREAGSVDASVLAERLRSSREGFEAVLADPEASADQLARAHRGLARAGVLPAPAGPVAPVRVVSRSQWGSRAAAPSRLTRHEGPWTRITVHHTAMSSGELGGRDLASSAQHLRGIQRYHMDEEHWGDIGYHFLIDPQGRLLEGRETRWQGAHAGGRNNIGNFGVCLLGDFDHERPTPAALATLESLLTQLRAAHSIPRSSVYGHQELKTTDCPGTSLMGWVQRYRSGSDGSAASPVARSVPRRGAARTLPASTRAAKVR